MPLIYDSATDRWEIVNASAEEIKSLESIGRQVVVDGLAGKFTNSFYNRYLKFLPIEHMGRS